MHRRVIFSTALAVTMIGACLALNGCNRSSETAAEMERYQASLDAEAAANLKAGTDFLAKTAKEPGVITLPTGVMYKIVSQATKPGAQPSISDTVTIDYEGKLLNGNVFDSSYARHQPAQFPLANLVPAWQQVIPLMHTGDEVMLYTPPSQAYGEADKGEIPPNSTLIFKVHLISVAGK